MESIDFTCKKKYLKNEFRAKKNFRRSHGVAGIAGIAGVAGISGVAGGFWTKFEAQLALPC
jgi:hypothetical protein